MINIGPTKDGEITPIFQERLLQLGEWLNINGEAIYHTSPWYYQKDVFNSYVWYTCMKPKYNREHPTAIPNTSDTIAAVYAIFLKWPINNTLKVGNLITLLKTKDYQIRLLGSDDFNNLVVSI